MPNDVHQQTPLPCPFCGASEDGLSIEGDRLGQYVYCHGCETQGPFVKVNFKAINLITDEQGAEAKREAIVAWNRRAS